jgi:hypothetical protein
MPKPLKLIATMVLALASCAAPAPPARAPTTPAQTIAVNVKTVDYGFVMPATVPAGTVVMHFENAGNEIHHAIVAQVNTGKSEDDVLEMLNQSPLLLIKVASTVGAVGDMFHGGQAESTLDLHPGKYMLVCFVPSLDGRLHASKGMIGFFDVAVR